MNMIFAMSKECRWISLDTLCSLFASLVLPVLNMVANMRDFRSIEKIVLKFCKEYWDLGGVYADASQHKIELYVDHKNVSFYLPHEGVT